MSWSYRHLIRPLLFAQDSESIHNRILRTLAAASKLAPARRLAAALYQTDALPVDAFGLHFPNPIGLAAGMDKQAAAIPMWENLGFGFCELGGVTRHPQPGNPQPRMFRAVPDEAIINRMGFNNPGAEALALRLDECRRLGQWPRHPVGMNLGKSKITPLAEAAGDYSESLRLLWPHLDFFVVNVSSPNTPGLRQLQDRQALDEILAALVETNAAQASKAKTLAKPILVKVAPDLGWEALDELLQVVMNRKLSGIIATNTTLSRPQTSDAALKAIYQQDGGLSGRPLAKRSTEVIRHIRKQTQGQLPIVGVGGIFNATDAWEKICAGACLIQTYTGFVYQGPSMNREIIRGLKARMQSAGLKSLAEAVGCERGEMSIKT